MFVFDDVKITAVKKYIMKKIPSVPYQMVDNILRYVAAQGLDYPDTYHLLCTFFQDVPDMENEEYLGYYLKECEKKVYFSKNPNDLKNLNTCGLFAEAVTGSDEELDKLNNIIDRLWKELVAHDERSYLMSCFHTVNKARIIELLKEAGILDGTRKNGFQINRKAMDQFILPSIPQNFDPNDYDNLMGHNLKKIRNIFIGLHEIRETIPVWTFHLDAIEYERIWKLFQNVKALLEQWNSSQAYGMFLIEESYHNDEFFHNPNHGPVIYQISEECMISDLAKGLMEIKRKYLPSIRYCNIKSRIDGTLSELLD